MNVRDLKPWLPHNDRPPGATVDTIIMHSTAGASAKSSIKYMRTKKAPHRVSYHYIIDRDGKVTKCVPASNRAWHAGESFGPQGVDCNDYSVGIAFANLNDGIDPYTEEAKDAARNLIHALKAQFPHLEWIASHWAIAPTRKTDPKGFSIVTFGAEVGLKPWKPRIASKYNL